MRSLAVSVAPARDPIGDAVAPLLDNVASALRAGATLHDALQLASERGPLAPTFRAVLVRVEAGMPLRVALDQLGATHPHRALRLAASALALGVETGGATAASLDAVAQAVRDESALIAEVRTLSAPVRASALVIGAAPLGFGLLITAIDPHAGGALLFTAFGRVCLVIGLALDATGLWWMRSMLDLRP
jgi:tight adherence protein B